MGFPSVRLGGMTRSLLERKKAIYLRYGQARSTAAIDPGWVFRRRHAHDSAAAEAGGKTSSCALPAAVMFSDVLFA